MTAIEVFEKITNEPKWYAGFCTPQNATNIKRRFEAGKLEYSTLVKMFNHFGYVTNCVSPWEKKPSCHICQKPLDIKVKADIYYCELHGPGI